MDETPADRRCLKCDDKYSSHKDGGECEECRLWTEPQSRCYSFLSGEDSETLALIAEHRLTPLNLGDKWFVMRVTESYYPREGDIRLRFEQCAEGPTIGEAVRACVARIRS